MFSMRRTLLAAVSVAALLSGCGTDSSSSSSDTVKGSGDKGSVTIAAANFGESAILANMYSDVLKKAGFTTTVKALTNREVIEPALEKGEVQLVPEYLSSLTEFLNAKKNGPNAKTLASPSSTKTLAALQTLGSPTDDVWPPMSASLRPMFLKSLIAIGPTPRPRARSDRG